MVTSVTRLPAYGLFGGSFDPIHMGHLSLAKEVHKTLGLEQMALLPAYQQPLKAGAGADSGDRAEMLRLALEDYPELEVDSRELSRQGPSYTVETLQDWRQQYGESVCLCFCLGVDSLLQLHKWKLWPALFELANLVVLARPGWPADELAELGLPIDLREQLHKRRCSSVDELLSQSAGLWIELEAPLMDVSSTQIREQLAGGVSPSSLALPAAVANYIERHGLYCAN